MKIVAIIGVVLLCIGLPGLFYGDPSRPEELLQIIFYCGGGSAAIIWSIITRNRKWKEENKEHIEAETCVNEEDEEDEEVVFDYFEGCKNMEEVKKRYRKLMQVYHPDYNSGNEEYSKAINKQYEEMKKRYGM